MTKRPSGLRSAWLVPWTTCTIVVAISTVPCANAMGQTPLPPPEPTKPRQESPPRPATNSATQQLERGVSAFKKKQYAQSVALLEPLVAGGELSVSKQFRALQTLGQAKFRLGDEQGARVAFGRVLDQNSDWNPSPGSFSIAEMELVWRMKDERVAARQPVIIERQVPVPAPPPSPSPSTNSGKPTATQIAQGYAASYPTSEITFTGSAHFLSADALSSEWYLASGIDFDQFTEKLNLAVTVDVALSRYLGLSASFDQSNFDAMPEPDDPGMPRMKVRATSFEAGPYSYWGMGRTGGVFGLAFRMGISSVGGNFESSGTEYPLSGSGFSFTPSLILRGRGRRVGVAAEVGHRFATIADTQVDGVSSDPPMETFLSGFYLRVGLALSPGVRDYTWYR